MGRGKCSKTKKICITKHTAHDTNTPIVYKRKVIEILCMFSSSLSCTLKKLSARLSCFSTLCTFCTYLKMSNSWKRKQTISFESCVFSSKSCRIVVKNTIPFLITFAILYESKHEFDCDCIVYFSASNCMQFHKNARNDVLFRLY